MTLHDRVLRAAERHAALARAGRAALGRSLSISGLGLLLASLPGLACGGSTHATTSAEAPSATAADTDTDQDGTPDALDRCVTEAGAASAGGCPPYDADMDGVPEAWSEFVCVASSCTQAYCIREAPALPVLYFARGQAAGQASEIPALVAALGSSGEAYISGHTSEDEPAQLGRERADWVIARLASQGVDVSRLQAVGFGSTWGKVDVPAGRSEADAERRVEAVASWFGPPGCTSHAIPLNKCPVPCDAR